MTWNNSYAIGIPEIDRQHKELCDRIDKLYEACNAGKGSEEALKVLDFLEAYTKQHFSDEERLQQKIGYPQYSEHKAAHDAFIKQIANLKAEMNANGATIPMIININRAISSWLINHILKMDTELKKYIK